MLCCACGRPNFSHFYSTILKFLEFNTFWSLLLHGTSWSWNLSVLLLLTLADLHEHLHWHLALDPVYPGALCFITTWGLWLITVSCTPGWTGHLSFFRRFVASFNLRLNCSSCSFKSAAAATVCSQDLLLPLCPEHQQKWVERPLGLQHRFKLKELGSINVYETLPVGLEGKSLMFH